MTTVCNNNFPMPDFLIVADINKTVTLRDSIKDEDNDVFSSQLTEYFKDFWDQSQKKCSYKEHVQQFLFPGDKRDPEIKKLQDVKINTFLKYLSDSQSPLYPKAKKLYDALKERYWDQKNQSVKSDVFPSFFNLVAAVNLIGRCSVMLPTFGQDGKKIAAELKKSKLIEVKFGEINFAKMVEGGGLQFESKSEVKGDKLKFESKSEVEDGGPLFESKIVTGKELLKRLRGKITIVEVPFLLWIKNKKAAGFSKIVPCVMDAQYKGRPFFTMFFDDNFEKIKKTDGKGKILGAKIIPAEAREKNIAFPKDIYGRPTSWDSPGVFAIAVKTVNAALRPNYFIDKACNELEKRGLDKDRVELLRTYSEVVGAS